MSTPQQKQIHALAKEIAQKLGETDRKPKGQITSIIRLCGAEFATRLLDDALEVEANGGMLTKEGDRRRTIGGIYFHLARERMSEELRQEIFYTWRAESRKRAEIESQFESFEWDQRAELVQELLQNAGKVSEVKINLVGRPEQVERRQNLVIVTLQDFIDEKLSLPSGVPFPAPDPVNYTVFISSKQWERVEQALTNPEDYMIVEGFAGIDAETATMAIYTTFVTTRKLMKKEKRQAKQRSAPKKSVGGRPAGKGRSNDEPTITFSSFTGADAPVEEPQAPPEPVIDIELPPGIPPHAATKLIELHKAAATFRDKIAVLETKPADQQFGLEMTQKLLRTTESQIEKLEQQYAQNAGDAG